MRLTSTPRLAGLLSLGLAPASAEPDTRIAQGRDIFEDVCAACHYATELDPLVAAPPVFAVQHAYADFSDQESYISAIARYIRAPSEATAQMTWAVERFGLMPAQDITEAEARAVGAYLYAADFTLPDWYLALYLDEYGAKPDRD